MSLPFQWDSGNKKHVTEDYPERGNTIEEVESLFADSDFKPLPDRIDSRGEQQYHSVGLSNQNRLLYVVFSIRNGQIRPISCRPASRKERIRYAQISQQQRKEDPGN
ncbi:BrnT family toxin [Spirosoma fluviale]|uniref:BrnT family toxin n=1 Tax=Spirosoma fluviale TaxID=1597977 RepID=UPI000BE329F3|nr:BrnT family toxin [Spirosoma fluviale]